MSRHSFDPDIAVQVGVNAAIIYQNLFFWIEKNEADGHNYRDGRYWTYNSVSAYAKLLPYLTLKQIRTAIERLIDNGLILKGNYNEDRYDRTAWYALTQPIFPTGHVELPAEEPDTFSQKGKGDAPQGKSLKNRYNPDINPSTRECAREVAEKAFERIWAAYPADRLRAKDLCLRAYQNALHEGFSPDEMFRAVTSYEQESQGFTRSKVSFSDNWFIQGRWRKRAEASQAEQSQSIKDFSLQLTRLTDWVKQGSELCRHISPTQARELLTRGLVNRADLSRVGVAL